MPNETDVNAVTDRYLSTDFVASDAKVGVKPYSTLQIVIVMFDETATTPVQCSADSILEVDDETAEEHSELPHALSNVIGTVYNLELKSHTYYEHGTFESFTCWRINPIKTVEEIADSSNIDAIADTDTPLYNRLARHPSVSTPAKPSEERKHKRVELEDSDTDATPVTDEEAKDATTGCSSGKIKKKRYIIDDSVSD
ncbi:hypothetical protein Tco_1112460 [Tanacetum coccineum]|uniref:Uncharacterized protein n=1 Tax=Tanacetum coccineum TaxID=301880 RepID=A0ABQ5IPI4_9ASTR